MDSGAQALIRGLSMGHLCSTTAWPPGSPTLPVCDTPSVPSKLHIVFSNVHGEVTSSNTMPSNNFLGKRSVYNSPVFPSNSMDSLDGENFTDPQPDDHNEGVKCPPLVCLEDPVEFSFDSHSLENLNFHLIQPPIQKINHNLQLSIQK